jgi:hypothetical protein
MSTDADELAEQCSWRHLIAVDRWAQACHDTDGEFFEARVRNMDSERHLRAALDIEVAREEPRQDRIALLNQRLAEVDDDQH